MSLHKLLVTPVVALLTDISVLDSLRASASEVERIFEHPLEALLKPEVASSLQLVSKGSEDWPYKDELYVNKPFTASSRSFFSLINFA